MDLNYFNNWKKHQKELYYNIYDNVQCILSSIADHKTLRTHITFTYISVPDRTDLNLTHHYFIFLPFITGVELERKKSKEKNEFTCNIDYIFSNYPDHNSLFFICDNSIVVPETFYKQFYNTQNEYLILKYNPQKISLEFPQYIFVSHDVCDPLIKIEKEKLEELENDILLNEEWFENKKIKCKFNLKLEFTQPKLIPWEPVNIKLELKSCGNTFFKFT